MDGKVTLIGTGHVFRIEEAVQEAIHALRPNIVCIELDRGRLQALLHKRRTGKTPPGKGGFVQSRLQRFQEAIANQYGSDVGGEMIGAYAGGQEVGARIALIDRPADATLKRTLKQLTWRERMRALGLIVASGVRGMFPSKRDGVEAEIKRYQEDPLAALGELQDKFPTVYEVVIAERDKIMAQNVRHVLRLHHEATQTAGHAVVVVGDGHVPGMMALLDDLDLTAYRLPDAREGRLPKRLQISDDGADASFSFET